MTDRSQQLIKTAYKFIREYDLPNMKCAYVGGSVGRGDSDEFSDLDISVWCENVLSGQHDNLVYEGEII